LDGGDTGWFLPTGGNKCLPGYTCGPAPSDPADGSIAAGYKVDVLCIATTTTTTTTTLPPTPKLNISRLVAGANTSTITSSFSGNGTSPTPYARSTSYFSDVDNQLTYYRFTATSSGTFYWKATADDDGNGDYFYVKKTSGGVITTITYSGTDSRSIGGSSGKDGTYGSMSMINGDIFQFVASNPDSASFSLVSIYAT
jgi:hypothetical protein